MKQLFKFFVFCAVGVLTAGIIMAGNRAIRKENQAERIQGFSQADIAILSNIKEQSTESIETETEESQAAETAAESKGDSDQVICVLLTNDGDYVQKTVQVTSDSDFAVEYGTKRTVYRAGETADVAELAKTVSFTEFRITTDADGRLTLVNYEKNDGTPSYRGEIIVRQTDGGWYAVNKLPLEEYLYAVVSSEMPSGYETEALAAQAVCARSYAVKKMQEGAYDAYGADVDDTTACQVYNNIFETEQTIAAVQKTTELVITDDGEIADTYFFSTSCGTTCRNDDVWDGEKRTYLNDQLEAYQNAEDQKLGAQTVMLDQGYFQIADGMLSTEEVFRDFIDGEIYVNSIEKEEPFYRWSAAFNGEELEDCLYAHIESLAGKDDANCYDADGEKMQGAADAITEKGAKAVLGELQNVKVTKRGNSGIAQSMVIYGQNASFEADGQMAIREMFGSETSTVTKQDGSTWACISMLPSAYFYIEKTDAGAYVLHGGGFGHGVGMSQNGANRLAKAGYGFEEIVAHYYSGATVENLRETGNNTNEEKK